MKKIVKWGLIITIGFIVLIFVIFYFLFIRPSQQKQKEHQEMIKSMSKGDRIVTQGGIHGKVTMIKENSIKIKVDSDTEMELDKNMIGRIKGKEQSE